MATRNQVVRELKRLGVSKFSKDIADITFVELKGGIDLDFWNIDQVCKSQHFNHPTVRGLSVRFLTKKNDYIHCGSVYSDVRDFSSISIQDLKDCKDWLDLKALVSKHRAIGLKVL